MAKRFRVAGTVSYVNELGQRHAIPHGTHVEIEELDGEPAALMRWRDSDGKPHEQSLSLQEWAQYTKTELKPLD